MLPVAAMTTLAGCTPSASFGGPGMAESWEWVHSVGGIAGRRTTPAEQGMRVRYTFGAGGTLVVRREPGGETRTRYTTAEVPGPDGTTWTLIRLDDEVNVLPPPLREQFLRRPGADTLVLSDPCADCFEHTFVRIR